ncbi:flavin reductase family protein [Marisediminicola senii]|uniref:flavin reductase family protein n=1 Tax=Marisediminicola senii TaxID=2711233 RepID=UPI0013ECDF9B|nr:flavin reductase family protein [Marisediminicola senii]
MSTNLASARSIDDRGAQGATPAARTLGGLSPEEFRGAFRGHPAGVAVVTADAGDGPVGLTATSVSSISADPPLLVFSLSSTSSSTPVIRRAETVVVHLLASEQLPIARLCSTSGVDRFADTSLWSRLETGEPYFPRANAWIRGRVIDQLGAGSSTVVVVHALESGGVDEDAASDPLVYHNRTWHRLGEHSTID